MATRCIASFSFASVVFAGSITSASVFSIPAGTGLFTPSFRGQANTTFFGWGPGSFDGTTDNELIDSPPTTLGGAAGANLVQNHTLDILASSNNIYTGGNTLDITITAPADGVVGTGFTTLIVQGKTAFGPFGSDPVFDLVEGVLADVVVATNAANAGQFFAKYQIPGNVAAYDIRITGGTFLSLNTLIVDTLWSPNGYAPDIAVVPEPATLGLLAGAGWFLRRHRR